MSHALKATALGIAAALLGGAGAAPPSPADAVRGTYRLHGTARVAARPALQDDVEVHADAVLRRGPGPRDVRAHLAAEGLACDLDGTVDGGGALAFPAGQRCVLDLTGPDARGRIDARLRSATGSVRAGVLALDATWEISGTVRLRTAGLVPGLGQAMGMPGGFSPDMDVRGQAHATAEGRRDASRAAGE